MSLVNNEQQTDISFVKYHEYMVMLGHLLFKSGRIEQFKELIENDIIDVNEKFENYSLLYLSLTYYSFEITKYLVEHGANVNDINGYNSNTALIQACEMENLDIVKYLVENGANVNMDNDVGLTPLLVACKKCNLDMVKYLTEHDADVKMKDINENTVLTITISKYNEEPELLGSIMRIIDRLIEYGADIYKRDKYGNTFLTILHKNGIKDYRFIKHCIEYDEKTNTT